MTATPHDTSGALAYFMRAAAATDTRYGDAGHDAATAIDAATGDVIEQCAASRPASVAAALDRICAALRQVADDTCRSDPARAHRIGAVLAVIGHLGARYRTKPAKPASESELFSLAAACESARREAVRAYAGEGEHGQGPEVIEG